MGRFKPSNTEPRRLTAVVNSPADHFEKLLWNFRKYDEIDRPGSFGPDEVAFAAIDFAIASWSMAHWLDKFKRKFEGLRGFDKDSVDEIEHHDVMTDIANTAKHAAHRERAFAGGEVWIEISQTPKNRETSADIAAAAGLEGLDGLFAVLDGEAHWTIMLRGANVLEMPFRRAAERNLYSWHAFLKQRGVIDN